MKDDGGWFLFSLLAGPFGIAMIVVGGLFIVLAVMI